jgi:hypothetical protein
VIPGENKPSTIVRFVTRRMEEGMAVLSSHKETAGLINLTLTVSHMNDQLRSVWSWREDE